jgi:hypothetical protein
MPHSLNGSDNVKPISDLAEDDMFAIEPWSWDRCDEELFEGQA